MDRLPQRFDAWGIRDQWKAPVLVRMIADIDVDAGTHRLLMRTRGLSRLWVDGKIVARSKPIPGSPSGEEPMTPVAEPPLPGLRIAEHRQQEVIGEFHVEQPKRCRVILETLVGGKAYRTDLASNALRSNRTIERPFLYCNLRAPTFRGRNSKIAMYSRPWLNKNNIYRPSTMIVDVDWLKVVIPTGKNVIRLLANGCMSTMRLPSLLPTSIQSMPFFNPRSIAPWRHPPPRLPKPRRHFIKQSCRSFVASVFDATARKKAVVFGSILGMRSFMEAIPVSPQCDRASLTRAN